MCFNIVQFMQLNVTSCDYKPTNFTHKLYSVFTYNILFYMFRRSTVVIREQHLNLHSFKPTEANIYVEILQVVTMTCHFKLCYVT